jgi:hypothetical protein
MTAKENDTVNNALFISLLAALTMAYGWGYRGIVGHEGGAMIPGAMLGMAICLASGRLDWYRRAAVAGLFAAVGWAWGGSFSYMEQTLYVLSDSFPNVLYGYAMLFLLGSLWAGIGGAVLGLAFTEKRSYLNRFMGPFTAICVVFLINYIYFFFDPELKIAYELFTTNHFHDGDWLAAVIVLVVSAVYWWARPKDRPAAGLFFWGAIGWWIGYLGLTKFGGLLLAPPYRGENWSGGVGILVVLLIYLRCKKNRAALMMSLYGIVGGGLSFALAVFIRHPVRVNWGPFADWGGQGQWKLAEETFGFFMGLTIALATIRLLRGGLVAAEEDEARKPLDMYGVFVMLIALMWINLRRGPMRWMNRFESFSATHLLGIPPWMWYVIGGAIISIVALYILYLYYRDELTLLPSTAFGKATIVFLLLLWVPAVGGFAQMFPNPYSIEILIAANFWLLAAVASLMVLSQMSKVRNISIPTTAQTDPSDAKWKVGWKYGALWGIAPVFLILITLLTMSMQEGPFGRYRYRFGPEAYWRQVQQLQGTWRAAYRAQDLDDTGKSEENLPVRQLQFTSEKEVIVTLASGERISDKHTWELSNPYMRLNWYGKIPGHPERTMITLFFREQRLYVPWPPDNQNQGYLVFTRLEGSQ